MIDALYIPALARALRGSDASKQAFACLYGQCHPDAPDREVKSLNLLNLLDAGICAPPPVTRFDRPPRSPLQQYLGVVATEGPNEPLREWFAHGTLDTLKRDARRLFGFSASALHYGAVHQLERVPMHVHHNPTADVRGAGEEIGFADAAQFDAARGCVFARLNIRRDAMQAEFQRRLREGEPLPLSLEFRGYRDGFDVVLFRQIRSVDLVDRALCTGAQVLGQWDDRAALIAAIPNRSNTTSAA